MFTTLNILFTPVKTLHPTLVWPHTPTPFPTSDRTKPKFTSDMELNWTLHDNDRCQGSVSNVWTTVGGYTSMIYGINSVWIVKVQKLLRLYHLYRQGPKETHIFFLQLRIRVPYWGGIYWPILGLWVDLSHLGDTTLSVRGSRRGTEGPEHPSGGRLG